MVSVGSQSVIVEIIIAGFGFSQVYSRHTVATFMALTLTQLHKPCMVSSYETPQHRYCHCQKACYEIVLFKLGYTDTDRVHSQQLK